MIDARNLEMNHTLEYILRTILRNTVEDEMSVPANYYITATYDYQADQLEVQIFNKIGLDVVVEGTWS